MENMCAQLDIYLSIRLSHHVCDNGLRVRLGIWSCRIFHLFVEEENRVYTCCSTPKKDVTLAQELITPHSIKFRLWQPYGI